MSVALEAFAPELWRHAFVGPLPAFAHLGLENSPGPTPGHRPPDAELRPVRPPGGILLLAVISAMSGAIMGLLFGGYLTIALTLFLALPAGVAVGIWATRFTR